MTLRLLGATPFEGGYPQRITHAPHLCAFRRCFLQQLWRTLDWNGWFAFVSGDVHHEAGAEASSVPNIRFVENVARGLGGAIHVNDFEQLVVRGAAFESNRATLGGAMYIASTEARLTEFSACVFDGNGASDGGAVYLATGSGKDTFVTSVFRDNSAGNPPKQFENFVDGAILTRERNSCSLPRNTDLYFYCFRGIRLHIATFQTICRYSGTS